MMRRILLIRHGKPQFPNESSHFCLGRMTDPPLSAQGREQVLAFGAALDFIPARSFYSSSLTRSMETAELLLHGRGSVNILPGVEELCCGEWEGLSFDVIRSRYPEIYAARQNDMSLPPPGGESFDSAAGRALHAISGLLQRTEGDIAIVAHAGVNRAVMCRLTGIPMSRNRQIDQQYACVNVLVEEDGQLRVAAAGRLSGSYPDEEEIRGIYEKCETPAPVRAHCRAVAEKAVRLALCLPESVLPQEELGLIYAAGLLHDACRTLPQHAHAAAEMLRTAGYMRLAQMIDCHHDAPHEPGLDGRKLLYLADKLISGDREATLSERFDASLKKCDGPEALRAHERRRAKAFAIYDEFMRAAAPAPCRKGD